MENEIKNFMKVWIIAILSICYCYFIPRNIYKGFWRFIFLLPIISLFTLLPLPLSTVHFRGVTAFYLVWLGNSKLILFAFDHGPLSGAKNLTQFLSISLLPVEFVSEASQRKTSTKSQKSTVVAVKVLLLAVVIGAYSYRGLLPDYLIYILYCCNLYLSADLVLCISSALVWAVLGYRIQPQFDEPYLARSLQEFWGHRWNLMVPSILRLTVYLPMLDYSLKFLNRKWARAVAMSTAFLVSGLMHELIYYYLTQVRPTWEVTCFFVLQGVSSAAEVAAKKAVAGRWTFPVAVSRLLTLAYIMVTAVWLFFPQIVRNGMDLKAIAEYHALADFVRAKLSI